MSRYVLAHCPRCGMDSGERKTFDGSEVKYLVICTTCGFHTAWHPTQSAAGNEWNRKAHEKSYVVRSTWSEKCNLTDFGNLGMSQYFEIIGNTYDNPELLKGGEG